jgi:hypothetical protein
MRPWSGTMRPAPVRPATHCAAPLTILAEGPSRGSERGVASYLLLTVGLIVVTYCLVDETRKPMKITKGGLVVSKHC